MNIGDRQIGPGANPYVIAEIGVNHDGDIGRARELTDAAARAGADAVKLQHFETDRLMSRAAKLAAYQKAAGETDPVAMLRRLELTPGEMAAVVERAHAHGLHAIVTIFSVELVDHAETLGWDAYKTASPDLVHRPLLERLARTGKPMIVSTGASSLEEAVRTVGTARGDGWLHAARDRLAVLHCVSSYPAPDATLGGIEALREATGLPTGYSDHTVGVDAARDACALGAVLLEKHLTHDRGAPGPDHAASLEPDEFRRYVTLAREVHGAAGVTGGTKRVLDCERDVRSVSRQSIVAVRDIEPGETIARADLTFKRPGTGLLPFELDRVVGARAANAIRADTPISSVDIAACTEGAA